VDNYSKINEEFFMSIIYDMTRNGDEIKITGSQTSHEPKYSILLLLNERHKYFSFTESELEDRKSLFYDYNQNLVAFRLFKLIESEIEED
jgi:hypothetical protein